MRPRYDLMYTKALELVARLGHALARWAELRLCLRRLGYVRLTAAPAIADVELQTAQGQTFRAVAVQTKPPETSPYGPS